jgi:hypothetical protein
MVRHRSVRPFAWDSVPNTSSRVLHIASSSRNEMEMTVEYCLPRHRSNIHSDIVTLNIGILRLKSLPKTPQESVAGKQFIRRK